MRCKCDYITFDQLDICPKCKKDISKDSSKLSGVTYRAEIPDYLQLDGDESDMEVDEVGAEMDSYEDEETETAFDEDIELDSEDEEINFVVDNEEDEDSGGEIDFDLSGDEEESADEDDIGIELAMGDEGRDDDGGLDLSLDDDDDDGGLDLSLDDDDGGLDLSLDDDDGGLDLSLDDDDDDGGLDLSLDDEGGLDLSLDSGGSDVLDPSLGMESDNAKGGDSSLDMDGLDMDGLDMDGLDIGDLSSSDGELGGLSLESDSDSGGLNEEISGLELGGLDLDSPSSGGSSNKKAASEPGAKTGTALDDFDIDLGDLGDLD